MKKYIKAINYNLRHVFYFELFFKLITLIVGFPCFKLFKFIVKKIANVDYFTLYDLKLVMFKPTFIILMVVSLLLLALYTLFDISCVLLMIHKGLDKESIKYKEIAKKALNKTISVFKPKNILYLLSVLLFLPFMYIGIYIILFKYVNTLNLFYSIITNNIHIVVLICILLLYLLFIYKTLYVIHMYIFEDMSYFEAYKKSNEYVRIKDILFVIVRKIVPVIVVYFVIMKLSELFFYVKYLNNIDIKLLSIYEGLIIASILYLLYYYMIKSFINDLAAISMMYFYKKRETVSIIENKNRVNHIYVLIKKALILILFVSFSIVMYNFNNGKIKYTFVYDYNYEVTAHRGASEYAPENSMAAFKLAKDMNADYIELDVHQTKDGIVYVMHDNTLLRTTNVDKVSNKSLWEEIKTIPLLTDKVEYQGETIPLFSDVVNWAKENNVRLNIELKPTKTDIDLPDKVVAILDENKYSNCVIASFVPTAITRVRELNPSYELVFLGYQIDFDYDLASYYSINYSSITPDIVNEVHERGKKIFAWTVNDENIAENMLSMGVDNIISNDPKMVQDAIVKHKDKTNMTALFDFILHLL